MSNLNDNISQTGPDGGRLLHGWYFQTARLGSTSKTVFQWNKTETTYPKNRALHQLFALFHPEAADVFNRLQAISSIPFAWDEREDDPGIEQLTIALQPLLEGVPKSGLAYFTPLLDWWTSGKDGKILPLYEELAREIGEHIRQVKEWNDEAAVIFDENKRLSADYEKMGKEFTKQQEFLAKQAATQAKVWEELKRTGDSWKEQRDYIDNVLEEKRGLLEELDKLREKLAAKGNSEA